MTTNELQTRFQAAVQQFWDARARQQQKQVEAGHLDAGTRGAATGGTQMGRLERLVRDLLVEAGLDAQHIHTRTALELPGYYRPEKKWDLLVVAEGQLVTAIEFKSQVGPSFGNNFNNRVEEAVGSAPDIWVVYREGRFETAPRPLLGYFFLLEDEPKVHRPVGVKEAYFPVDPVFQGASYSQRYELLCRRLLLKRLYDTACLTLATKITPTKVSHPTDDLTFQRFVAVLQGQVHASLKSEPPR